MKMAVYFEHKIPTWKTMMMGALACLSLTGCRDQNFDWESVKSENIEYQYGQLMEKIFGEIGPDHSWDNMAVPEYVSSGTRASYDVRNATTGSIKWEGDTYRNLDWYYVDTKMFNSGIASELFDESTGHSNLGLGGPCSIVAPAKDFWVTLAVQGANSYDIDLYMEVTYKNSNNVNITDTYFLWKKSEVGKIQHLPYGTTGICSYCDGSGYTRANCGYCNGTGYEKCTVCAGTGKITCSTCNGNGHTRSGNRYYGCTACGGSGNSTNLNRITQGTGKINCTACDGHGHTETPCNNCNGTGEGEFTECNHTHAAADGSWKNTNYRYNTTYNELTTGTTQGAARSWNVSQNIRSKRLHFVQEGSTPAIPVGAQIVFRVDVHQGDGKTWRTTDKVTSGSGNNKQTGSPIAVLKDATRPSNIDPTHSCLVIGCEGSVGTGVSGYNGDFDLNDIILLYESSEEPIIKPVDRYEITVKRYMMEDLGYDAKETIGENVVMDESDIDFNDIVVDFVKKVHVTEHYQLGQKSGEDDVVPVYTRAYVRALGGTMDFTLKVADNVVFQKSTAGTASTSGITINKSYFDLATDGTFEGFDPELMYNTAPAANTVPHTNGKKITNTYLAKLEGTAINNWNPETNNISAVVIKDPSNGNSAQDQGNVYVLTFPEVGDKHPKIIAFGKILVSTTDTDITDEQICQKMVIWRDERQAITRDWFDSNKGNKSW